MSRIPSADWSWIDTAAQWFERAWKKGPRPRIEDFLAKVAEPQRPARFRELLRVERELRRRAAEGPTALTHLRFRRLRSRVDREARDDGRPGLLDRHVPYGMARCSQR
jgi:hypothetical protein